MRRAPGGQRGASSLLPLLAALALLVLPLAAAAAPGTLPGVRRLAAGDWAVWRLLGPGRQADLSLKAVAKGRTLELERLLVAPGEWREARWSPAGEGGWGWAALPRMLLWLFGEDLGFELRGYSLAPEAEPVGPPAPPRRGRRKPRPLPRPKVRLRATFAGPDPRMGGLERRLELDALIEPGGRVGGVLRASLQQWLRLPDQILESTSTIERLRQGSARSLRKELERFEAR